MMPRLFKLPVLLPVISTLIIAACSPLAHQRPVPPTFQTAPLTDAEQIAGDTMAYLMEVVLGRAGNPAERSAWATRGLNLPLDFDLVSKRMYGPVPLRAELMVLDTNILGLSEVLLSLRSPPESLQGEKRKRQSLPLRGTHGHPPVSGPQTQPG